MSTRRPVRLRVLVLAYLGLAGWISWPLAAHLGGVVPGSGRTDLWNSLWSLWSFAEALAGGRSPWRTALLNWPQGGPLQVADPLDAALLAPVVLAGGVVLAYDILVLGQLCFSGVAAHLLARHLYRSDRAGWVAGISFAAAPVLISAVHDGSSEDIGGGWLALSVLASLLAAERGGFRSVLLAAAALVVCCLGSWYAGAAAWLAWVSVLALGRPATERWRSALRLLPAGVLALAVVVPVGLWESGMATRPGNLLGIKGARELALVRRTTGAADPRGWFLPGDFRSPDFRVISRYGEDFIHCHYLGWVLLLASLATRRRGSGAVALAGGLGLLLAMGPVLAMDGQPVVLRGRLAIPMPYFALEGLPGFSSLSLVYRLAVLPSLAVSVLAGGAVAGRGGRWGPVLLAALAFAELRLASPVAGMPHMEDAQVPESIHRLATAPAGAVMNFPVVGGRGYLYEQVVHHKPLAATLNFPNNGTARRLWREMVDASSAGRAGPDFVRAIRPVASRLGIRYLVVHRDPLARPDMHDAAVRAVADAFPRLSASEDAAVYVLW